MDRHLNVFVPYERPAHHEDQLTRAAMIVMNAIPLARDALLSRIGAPPSVRLPAPEIDMQTRYVVEPPALPPSESEGLSINQLTSIFLTPDEGRDLPSELGEDRPGEQRLDGVLRFGDELVVVIESKVVGRAPSDQASRLKSRGVQIDHSKVQSLGWHDLLEDWWSLVERGLLGPAEQVLMDDLIALTEEHFRQLLPFTTLGRAGEHDLRVQRRLVALLRDATGITEARPERESNGATVMLDDAIKTKSTQRISLQRQAGGLALRTWPAELKPQADALYQTGRVLKLVNFLALHSDVWQARPNVHLAYRFASSSQRLYLQCHLSIDEYIQRWQGDDFSQIRAHRYEDVQNDLWPWLLERKYASAGDTQRLGAFLDRLGHRDAHLRPGIEIRRIWPWPQAVDLDDHGRLVREVRTAIVYLLAALDEPLPRADAQQPAGEAAD